MSVLRFRDPATNEWKEITTIMGPAGPQGPKGEDGGIKFEELTDEQKEQLRGPQGIQGETGPQGPKGDTGERGPEGPAGQDGVDYVLTEADKQEIAGMVEVSGGGDVDLSDYYTKSEVDGLIPAVPVKSGTGINSLMTNNATAANGMGGIALGPNATAQLGSATAIGPYTTAYGMYSIAMGDSAYANKAWSVAIGRGVYADAVGQTAIGIYNATDSTSTFVIGNGSSTAKRNAMTIDTDNVAHFPGNIKVGANDEEVATKAYVDANAGGGAATAADISYDNTESQIEATTVQDAIDHLFETAIDATYVENLGYQTEAQVNALIATALGNIGVAEEGSY